MKSYLNLILLLLTLGFAAGCSEQGHEHAAGETQYTCPMHPQVVQAEPGVCPVCKMDLVPRSRPGEGRAITDDLASLLHSTTGSVVANVATIRPTRKSVQDTLEMDGVITYDPRQVHTVAARAGGRIERLYVKYNFQPIRKGQKLMDLYSPELITAQKELLYLVQSAPEDQQLQEAARQKLRLLGATKAQIQALIARGRESYTFTLFSPYDGYVTGLNAPAPAAPVPAAPAAGGGMAGMGGGSTAAGTAAPAGAGTGSTGQDIQLQEGMYVSVGQPLLRVVNPAHLWAEFRLPAHEASRWSKGTPVRISFPQLPGKQLAAKVNLLQPFYLEGENFASIRVYLPASTKGMMAGQLVSAGLALPADTALWVPEAAVLDLGIQSVSFKKAGGVFVPVVVTRGRNAGRETQIVKGLQPQDTIAANAQYLVDSESFVKVNK